MTEPEPLRQIERTYVCSGKRKLSYFSGCDYFRMSSHPEVRQAVTEGLRKFGLSVSASRLTTGNHILYGQLESALRKFFRAEDALLVGTGYLTNLVVAQALAGNFSHVVMDERAHPSLADAAEVFSCPLLKFRHRDVDSAAQAVKRCGRGSRVVLLTDGMFSHDGSPAPLAGYLEILHGDAVVLVDDSHGAGVLGSNGRGTPEHECVDRERIIQTITLSKAFGAYGGAILGTKKLRKSILDRSRMFVGHTPPPLPLVYAALKSISVLAADPKFLERLRAATHDVKTALATSRNAEWGAGSLGTPGPIIRLDPESPRRANAIRRTLLGAGIYPPFLRYPGGPAAGYFRFVLSSEHTERQLGALKKALSRA